MAVSDLFSGLTVNLTGVVQGNATIDNNGVITINTTMTTNQFEGQDISTSSAYAVSSGHYDTHKIQQGGVYYIDAKNHTWDNLPSAISKHEILYIIFGAKVGGMIRYLRIAWSITNDSLYMQMQTSTDGYNPWKKVTLTSIS